jgi:hypothetical protein
VASLNKHQSQAYVFMYECEYFENYILLRRLLNVCFITVLLFAIYEGNSVSKLQIQVATYVFKLSAGNCHR